MNRCPFCLDRASALTSVYDECPRCDVWISRIPPAAYDNTYYYSRDFRSRDSLYRARLLFRYFKPEVMSGRCLDYGCNDGAFVVTANENGASCLGADINRNVLETAIRRGGGSFCHADEVKGAFSCVTAFDVLEHFNDIEEFFAEVAGWLEPGGKLILTTPNKNSKWYKIFRDGWHGLRIPEYHRYVFSRTFLKAQLTEHGYCTEREFSVSPINRHGWRLLIASGCNSKAGRIAKWGALPKVLGRFVYGSLVSKGEEDTLCLVARRRR